MKIVKTRTALDDVINGFKSEGKRVGFVPTMGALHAGHLSLAEVAKKEADVVVASVFVNPTQFAPDEDFDTYPRDDKADADKLEKAGVHVIYMPDEREIYGDKKPYEANANLISTTLEGEYRPHFFDGVRQVVGLLFDHVQPDVVVFGEKDFQQLAVIKQMVVDEKRSVQIIGAPTIREDDGLAMSSRNLYLLDDERIIAPELYSTITDVAKRFANGESPEKLKAWAFEYLLECGFRDVDYIAIRDSTTLQPISEPTNPSRVLAAVWLGKTRLIDNVAVPVSLN